MKITVITPWYNEELLAPLFFNHYSYCNEIRVLLETDTNDMTRKMGEGYKNVVFQDVHCPDGMDNQHRINIINEAISEVREGWVYVVDADEFMFPEYHEDPRVFLSRQTAEVVSCKFYHVYRHTTDADIDYSLPPVPQRVHALDGGPEHYNWFIKPSIRRAEGRILSTIGNHHFAGEHTVSEERYIGSHWKQADYNICITRRLSNRKRHSQHDRKHRWGRHDFYVTEEGLRKWLDENLNYPVRKELVECR